MSRIVKNKTNVCNFLMVNNKKCYHRKQVNKFNVHI